MKKSIFENKKVLWTSLAMFGFMILFVAPIFFNVEEKSARRKINNLCYINLQKLGTSLLQYAKKEGKFPQHLSQLESNSTKFTSSPLNGAPYAYLASLNNNVPFNIPILVEHDALHVTRRGEKYGMVLSGDFKISYATEQLLSRYVRSMAKWQKIIQTNDAAQLFQKLNSEMQYRNDNITINLLLWKLGELKYKPAIPIMKKCQQYYNPANSQIYSLARSIAFQANYSLYMLGENYNKKFMAQFLTSDNYFHRKKVWGMLKKQDEMLINTPISPRHAQLYLDLQKK
ncbi:hypothetical protein [Candidatus Uabimicrobium sp. HlEnr_7]|uniref:hypothetical protein n=1 Tax=Candidatus Uabimicrobium helgolandensis TaxID=3095367 RepID=UPI0035577942